MFQIRRQATFGNISLGKLSATPSPQDLHFIQEQALRHRARFVEVEWTVASGTAFQLTAKMLPTEPDPSWMLYKKVDGEPALIWGHSTSDLTLMHNLIMMECERTPNALGNNAISSDALDLMMDSNASTGSLARRAADSQQGLHSANTSGSRQKLQSGARQADTSHQSLRAAKTSHENVPGWPSGPRVSERNAAAYNKASSNVYSNQNTPTSGMQAMTQSGNEAWANKSAVDKTASVPNPGFNGTDPASMWLKNLGADAGKETVFGNAFAGNNELHGADLCVDKHPGGPDGYLHSVVSETGAYPPSNPANAMLNGSLTNVTVPSILQYVHEQRLSGRVAFQCLAGAGEVFVRDGDFHHAATLESKGENALYDIATWSDGEFYFLRGEQTSQHTLAYEPSVLIAHCQRMRDYGCFLKNAGLRMNSYLDHPEGVIGREQFEQKLNKSGVACDMQQQWRFYETANGNRTLSEILRVCPLTRAEWMPIAYNLIRMKLLLVRDKPVAYQPGRLLEPVEIDQSTIDRFMMAATYPADGLMSKGLFLWLLQQEFYRFQRSGARFAFVIFNVSRVNKLDGTVSSLAPEMFAQACRHLLSCKRKLDSVGHFDEEFGILMPETDSAGAAVFVHRVLETWGANTFGPEVENGTQDLLPSFGIASVPDDVRDLGALIAATRIARKRSAMVGSPVVLYGETI